MGMAPDLIFRAREFNFVMAYANCRLILKSIRDININYGRGGGLT